jgi:hypothetical protein
MDAAIHALQREVNIPPNERRSSRKQRRVDGGKHEEDPAQAIDAPDYPQPDAIEDGYTRPGIADRKAVRVAVCV